MHNKHPPMSSWLPGFVRAIEFCETLFLPTGQWCPMFIAVQPHWPLCYALNTSSMFSPQDRCCEVLLACPFTSLSLCSKVTSVTSPERAAMSNLFKIEPPTPHPHLYPFYPCFFFITFPAFIPHSNVYLFVNSLPSRM